MKHRIRLPALAHRQAGVVLIVALVMLVIIGLASAAIMRNVLTGDTVSDNNRRQAHALQAAQAALRYCEGKVQDDAAANALPAVANIDDEDWKNFSNWLKAASTAGAPKTVPASFLTPGGTNPTVPKKLPQCMAQFRTVGAGKVIVVTARGFSENYEADSTTGRTQAGAVVWLQSIIQLES